MTGSKAVMPNPEPNVLLAVRQFSIRDIDSTEPLVAPINLEVAAGECVALTGDSGVGKSLTLRGILGLLPESMRVDAAQWTLLGRDVARCTQRQRRSMLGAEVGYVAQDALGALDPLVRVAADVRETREIHSSWRERWAAMRPSAREQRERFVRGALADVGFEYPETLAHRRAHTLSGGMRQRVLLASALSVNPLLLLLDEPTTALDAKSRSIVVDRLRQLKSRGVGILLVSHDSALRAAVADRQVALSVSPARDEFSAQLAHSTPPKPPSSALDDQPSITLELEGVTTSFLHDVTFATRASEFLALIGPSGAGKSTLIRSILGFNSHSGTIRKPSVGRIQWIPQDALASFPRGYTTRRLLAEVLAPEVSVETALAEVGLDASVLSLRPAQLSGGQRQRLAIARALARNPDVLLADEPVAALDARAQRDVIALLNRLRQHRQMTVVLVSHDLRLVSASADTIGVLDQGRLVEYGLARDVLADPQHPTTRQLLESAVGGATDVEFD